jgi:MarR family
VTVDHDQLAAWLARERDLAARGVKRGHERPAQTPVTRPAKLLPVDWRVLERLAGYGPRGIWPGVPELAARLGVCRRTVQRSLRRLEAAGRVERVAVFEHPDDDNWTARGRRIRHLGAQATNTYRLADSGDTSGTSARAVTRRSGGPPANCRGTASGCCTTGPPRRSPERASPAHRQVASCRPHHARRSNDR